MKNIIRAGVFGCLFFVGLSVEGESLVTHAEKTKWLETGRYAETLTLVKDFEKTYPKNARAFEFGKSPEGRPMVGLVVAGEGYLRSDRNRSERRPVVLFQGGIHSGEIDGKDAGFWFLRELLQGTVAKDALKKVTLVFVPVFSVDGHERFGAWNRPNQVGPREMGWRTTSQNLNLNRDYLKAESAEMTAMLKLLDEWDPILYIDLHVTDGADFQHVLSVQVDPAETGPEPLRQSARKLRSQLMDRLTVKGHLPLPFYPSFREDDDPKSGFAISQLPVRFSNAYWGARNRLGMLVETHAWKNYATRVKATFDTLVASTELAVQQGSEWCDAAAAADSDASKLSGKSVVLSYGNTERYEFYNFRGYAYTRVPSPISGGIRTTYDPSRPQIWRVPLFTELKPEITVEAPALGYVVEPGVAELVRSKLDRHGIRYQILRTARTGLNLETFRAAPKTATTENYEGRLMAKWIGGWKPEKRNLSAGAIFIPIEQPKSRLVLHLVEPTGPDSLGSWGFFNAFLEQKEFLEDYVAEIVAEEMLKNPEIAAAFKKKLSEDAEFAKSPSARLEFFHRLHPSWDERYQLYPIYRVRELP